jgi:ABC-type nitrate/sulfonate/bicarbonate transport system substrate-binding protein
MRKAACFALLTFWLLPVASPAATAPLPRVRIVYSSISSIFAGLWVAKETGAFERYGVRGELLYIGAGSIAVQAMMGGEVEVVAGAGNAVIAAILQGAPLISVGSVANLAAMTLWVQPDIKRPEQLQGKVLGISRHGSTTHYLTLVALEKIGLKDKVKLQALGGAPETDASFRAGLIHGAVRSVKPDPRAHGLADLAELKIPFPMDLFAVNRDYYKNQSKIVEGMLKAYSEGVATIKRRKEVAVEIIRKYLRKTDVEDSYQYAARYLEGIPRVDPAGIQTVLAWEGKSDIAPGRFYDNAIIDRLAQEKFFDSLYK